MIRMHWISTAAVGAVTTAVLTMSCDVREFRDISRRVARAGASPIRAVWVQRTESGGATVKSGIGGNPGGEASAAASRGLGTILAVGGDEWAGAANSHSPASIGHSAGAATIASTADQGDRGRAGNNERSAASQGGRAGAGNNDPSAADQVGRHAGAGNNDASAASQRARAGAAVSSSSFGGLGSSGNGGSGGEWGPCCSEVCGGADAAPGCSVGTYATICDPGWGDCDDDPSTGCEAYLLGNDADNCGACHSVCPPATPFCGAGTCRGHWEIALVGAPSGGSATDGRTLTFTHDLVTNRSDDNHRLLVVVIAIRGSSASSVVPAVAGVTYDGAPFTLVPGAVWRGAPQAIWSGIYYLKDAALPAESGSHMLSINTGTTREDAQAIVAAALELTGVDQTDATVDVATAVMSKYRCNSRPPTASITSSAEGDFVVDVVVYDESSRSAAEAASGQTKLLEFAASPDSGFFVVSGYKTGVTPAGAEVRMDWTEAKDCGGHAHSVAAFRRAGS